MMGFASPCIYGCIIYPERNRAPFAQSLIVLRPASYLLSRLTHVVTALTTIKGQIAGLEKGSTDLGNNALARDRETGKLIAALAYGCAIGIFSSRSRGKHDRH
ncbi:hypothetical protein [Vibrio coralliilyticus]|uniref:hypothetical protein n=1 Tax=Vibrio coralliilyticus TaxID=190893 RepID=UPI0006CDB956|nr:hypothetical protein [Vibrio coralliilyticus]KPH27503.1 hypothetical protein ADU60_04395 [Vibrio coralliilyticus]